MLASYKRSLCAAFAVVFVLAVGFYAQAQSNSASINGTVLDPSGAVVANANVEIHNPVSHFDRSVTTDSSGKFSFSNVPFNPYHLSVAGGGFAPYAQDVEIRSAVPLDIKINLKVAGSTQTVTVEAAEDLLENTSTEHTDVDRGLFDRLPLESQSSDFTSLVTLASPGIAADSNGLFHGLGDHAENSLSLDGQPVTDQMSKVFSNQIPAASIQSMEVIQGAPPAEYGGKTSVVIDVTTRSGLGVTKPHGEVSTSYGTFGTSALNANLSYGGEKWGNFVSLGGLNTGRFLDPPEFVVLHDKGNEENFFDRFDYKLSDKDSLQLNLGFTRSWFQTPNSFDQQLQLCTPLSADCNGAPYVGGSAQLNPITGVPLGPTDQRSQIRTFNIAPTWTRLVNSNTQFTFGAWVRHDQYNYYPSNDPFNDFGPLQDETTSQLRFLTNTGVRSSVTYVRGAHNLKIGAQYEQTFLTENDGFGIVNPGLLTGAVCPDPTNPKCTLVPYDLTTGGQIYNYHGHTDVKELALYAQDTITEGAWVFNLGLRGDFYNGLDTATKQPEPRVGVAYNIKKTNTVLRISYARTMESPFNENLILSGTGCNNPVVNAVMTVAQGFACSTSPLATGFRNEFHAGLEQAFGKHFVLSGEYIWKYTHNGYDFNVFGASPITLPIEWHNSKIPGFAIRGSMPEYHGLSAFIVMSHVSARFFPPTVAGIAPPAPPAVFRIDHDEVFNETTHLQYQPWKRGPWMGFNWRYDSGLVAGFVPCLAATATCSFSTSVADGGANPNVPSGFIGLVNNLNGVPLTADQEFQSGLTCNGVTATPTRLIGQPAPGAPAGAALVCAATGPGALSSSLIKIPAPFKEQDDHNPQRIASRSLFDLALGHDNLFHGEKYKWSARLTVINLTNKYALYNFLSTFSGTHYVTPRTLTAELGFHF
jgi:Carboxypeptidase regulatory-like domain